MKKYKLLKPFSFLREWDEIYATFEIKETNLEHFDIKNFVKIYTQNKTYIWEMEILRQDEWLEGIREKPKSVWELKDWDLCYSIRTDNDIIEMKWWFGSASRICRDIDFLFLTREEAEQELRKRQAIQRIKKYCWENWIELANSDFIHNSDNTKYHIYYDVDDNKFYPTFFNICLWDNPFFFKTDEDTKKVIENCEDDLKIIFNV